MLMSLLERRLDNVVHRMGFGLSRSAARQLINHGHVTVNGRRVDVPSYLVKVGDVVRVKNRAKSLDLVRGVLAEHQPRCARFPVGDSRPIFPKGSWAGCPGGGRLAFRSKPN